MSRGMNSITVVILARMPIARSSITAQGQISIPAPVRQKLGVGPGSVIEWDEVEGRIELRRAGKFTFGEIHNAVFPEGPPTPHAIEELREGLAADIRNRHQKRSFRGSKRG
jgi:AbrB family looped-hinge helix DNA binding protein